jgi:gliding motility-associated-like protein
LEKQIDKCLNTKDFNGQILPNGDLFFVRTIENTTIISKVTKDGNLSDCSLIPINYSPFLFNPLLPTKSSIYASNHYLWYNHNTTILPANNKIDNLLSVTKSFCLKVDASFDLPNQLCLFGNYNPKQVDTSLLLKHDWSTTLSNHNEIIPNFSYNKIGKFKVKHYVQIGICQDTFSKIVTVLSPPKLSLKDTVVCGASSLKFDMTDTNATAYFLDKQPSTPVVTISKSGFYDFKIANDACIDSTKVNVKIVDFESPFQLPNNAICVGDSVPIFLSGFENITLDGNTINTDTIFITDAAKHFIKATYSKDKDCVMSKDIAVVRKKCKEEDTEKIFFPTIFSPNNDGINDVFYPMGKEFTLYSMTIYDRWGDSIFHSEGKDATWYGRYNNEIAQQGVYTFLVKFLDLRTNVEKTKAGTILLLR